MSPVIRTEGRIRLLLARTGANLSAWAAALARKPRPVSSRALIGEATPVLLLAALLAGVIAVTMTFIDAPLAGLAEAKTPLLRWSFERITDLGKSGWFLYPLGIFILTAAACASPSLGRIANYVLVALVVRAGFLFLAISAPGLIVTIAKRIIGRVRPSQAGPFAYEPFSWKAAFASMPSGHSTTAFAAAVAIGALWPRARPFIWAYAVMIGVSRLVVHAHYASDVLAGAGMGALGAIMVRNWFANRRLGFVITIEGSVRAMPFPSLQRIKRVARRISGH